MKTAKVILGICLISAIGQSTLASDESGHASPTADQDARTLVVYKDPNCGCCGKWAEHMETHGFSVENIIESDLSARKRELGVPPRMWSCHTAVIDGYVIEGHVPAADVERLLGERPKARGLAVPGMPLGSPGMEQGSRRQAYDVLLFGGAEGLQVFNHYSARP